MTTPQNPAPQKRVQSPEDAMNRMAGVPRTDEELEAERKALDEERVAEARRNAGIFLNDQSNAPLNQPTSDAKPATSTRSTSSKDTNSTT